jgi:tetratricopeptide (TPR) repeat protein
MNGHVMNIFSRQALVFILSIFLLTAKDGSSQGDSARLSVTVDTSLLSLKIDTSLFSFTFTPSYISLDYVSSAEYLLQHDPSEADKSFYENHKKLIGTAPAKKNYSRYYSLACALWELGKTEEAKHMFLQIMNSKESYYCGTYYHGSDVSGRKKSGRYGYGSYTSNYKHYASCYLAKIHAERKEFDQALGYVVSADTIYPIAYSCGTGHMMHRWYMKSFYVMCYEGQGNYTKVVDLLLDRSYNADGALLRSLKKLYQPQAIRDSLAGAINSLVFVPDSLPTTYYSYENYGEKNEVKIETTFMSGSATMCLFGHMIEISSSYLNQGEIASRDMFVKDFLESGFYRSLSNEE